MSSTHTAGNLKSGSSDKKGANRKTSFHVNNHVVTQKAPTFKYKSVSKPNGTKNSQSGN